MKIFIWSMVGMSFLGVIGCALAGNGFGLFMGALGTTLWLSETW